MSTINAENQLLLYSIGGARGVGKTTIVKYLVSAYENLEAIFVSCELSDFCKNNFAQNFFDLPTEEKDAIRTQHGEKLITRLEGRQYPVLLDLHYTDISEGKTKLIQPDVILKCITAFVLLDAESDEIIQRMSGQAGRGRTATIGHIEEDRLAEVNAAKNLAHKYERPYFYIDTNGLTIREVAIGLYGFLQLSPAAESP